MRDIADTQGHDQAQLSADSRVVDVLTWCQGRLSDAAGAVLAEGVDVPAVAAELTRRFGLDAAVAAEAASSSSTRYFVGLPRGRQLLVASIVALESASSSGDTPGRLFILVEEQDRALVDDHLRDMLDAIPVPILVWTWSDDPLLILSNEIFRQTTGLEQEALTGMSFAELLQQLNVEFYEQEAPRAGMGRMHGVRFWLTDATGSRGFYVLQVAPMRISGGPIAVVFCLDITHTVQAERAMQARELARLAASISHDINNALTILGGILGELVDSDRSMRLELAEDVGDTIDGMKSLLSRLQRLSVGQAIALATESEPVAFDVRAVTERICRIFLLQHPDLELKTAFFDTVPMDGLFLPAVEYERALLNLLVNAVNACGEQAHVRVSVRGLGEGGGCVIEVEDDGPGFPEDLLDKAFEPHVSTNSDGLGLFQVRSLAMRTGGDARAGRSAELGGARVTLSFGAPPQGR